MITTRDDTIIRSKWEGRHIVDKICRVHFRRPVLCLKSDCLDVDAKLRTNYNEVFILKSSWLWLGELFSSKILTDTFSYHCLDNEIDKKSCGLQKMIVFKLSSSFSIVKTITRKMLRKCYSLDQVLFDAKWKFIELENGYFIILVRCFNKPFVHCGGIAFRIIFKSKSRVVY